MSEPRALVEHFFRHEFGRLVAVLTRLLSVRRLALVEDVVQDALVQALETWSRGGVPEVRSSPVLFDEHAGRLAELNAEADGDRLVRSAQSQDF